MTKISSDDDQFSFSAKPEHYDPIVFKTMRCLLEVMNRTDFLVRMVAMNIYTASRIRFALEYAIDSCNKHLEEELNNGKESLSFRLECEEVFRQLPRTVEDLGVLAEKALEQLDQGLFALAGADARESEQRKFPQSSGEKSAPNPVEDWEMLKEISLKRAELGNAGRESFALLRADINRKEAPLFITLSHFISLLDHEKSAKAMIKMINERRVDSLPPAKHVFLEFRKENPHLKKRVLRWILKNILRQKKKKNYSQFAASVSGWLRKDMKQGQLNWLLSEWAFPFVLARAGKEGDGTMVFPPSLELSEPKILKAGGLLK